MKFYKIAQGDTTTRIKQAIIFVSRETGVDTSRAKQFIDALYQNLGDVSISQLKNALDFVTPEESDKYHNPVQMPQAVATPLGSIKDSILQTSKKKMHGLADKENITEKDVDPKELAKGVKIEMEHTSDKKLANEIALDHLAEDPKYYTHLQEMEDKYSK